MADTAAFPGTAPAGGTHVRTVTVNDGVVPGSGPVTFPRNGTFWWAAFYSGENGRNDPAVSDCSTEELVVLPVPAASMTVVKTASVQTFQAAGTPVTYFNRVTNTGTVALDKVTVTDSRGLPVSCPHTSLAAGASMTCTAHYVTTAADVARGSVSNVATVTGAAPEGTEARTQSALTLPFTRPRPPAPVSPITRVRVPVTG